MSSPPLISGAMLAVAFWFGVLEFTHAQDRGANPTHERLQDVRKTLERDTKVADALAREARKQADELSELRTRMRVAAQSVQTHEAAMDMLETELVAVESDAARKRLKLAARRSDLGTTVAALQRMALRPTLALLVSPGDLNDIVRSGLLLRTAVPEIERQARVLRADIHTLTGLQFRIRDRKTELESASAELKRERLRLKSLSDSKNRILTQTKGAQASAEKRMSVLRAEASSLEELLSNLRDRTVSAASQQNLVTPTLKPSGPSISSARGKLSLPAQGTVVRRFGSRTNAGVSATGVTWKTRSETSVVAPWDGTIVFAGPFRRFGQILIIDHGEGYHSLIAGLGQIDAQMDQWVLAGEPVGTTSGGADAKSGGWASQAQSRFDGARLYVELRRDGQPINPLPWLAAQINRTQG